MYILFYFMTINSSTIYYIIFNYFFIIIGNFVFIDIHTQLPKYLILIVLLHNPIIIKYNYKTKK